MPRKTFKDIDLGWEMGSIGHLLKNAIEICEATDCRAGFNFNGVKVRVTKHTNINDMAEVALKAVQEGTNQVTCKNWEKL